MNAQTGTLDAAIRDVYLQVHAPPSAAADPDALRGVLRDLSWMPEGPVTVRVPQHAALSPAEFATLVEVLMSAEADTAHGRCPVRVIVG